MSYEAEHGFEHATDGFPASEASDSRYIVAELKADSGKLDACDCSPLDTTAATKELSEAGTSGNEVNNGRPSGLCHSSTITDIYNGSELAEVELVSLLEEKIPRYKLRADTLTQFAGYENEDWFIQTPVLPPDTEIDLSPEVIEETLKYFILCADRLSQMTKTYNDIDAVTRLLEEKERDLELAARIGQTLLEQNKELRLKNEQLEQELTIANDTVTQLRHELTMKNGLLQIYSQDVDTDSEAGSPSRERGLLINWDVLNKKINSLEEENLALRHEASSRCADIEQEEKKEMQLISDLVKQIGEANLQISLLQDELARKTEDNLRQQDEITQLLTQLVELQRKARTLTAENEDLQSNLHASQGCQNELSIELMEMKEKYGELLAALQELQEENKKSRRNRGILSSSNWPCGIYSPYLHHDSLASELESSLSRGDSEGYASDDRASSNRRVFETVRCANTGRYRRSNDQSSHNSPAHGRRAPALRFSSLSRFSLSNLSDSQASDSDSFYGESSQTDDDSQYSSLSSFGRNGSSDYDLAFRKACSSAGTNTEGDDRPGTVLRCQTPDSVVSNRSGRFGTPSHSVRHYHIPEKLQIIKPLEGSLTLHHWQKLATPHLGGIFEPRPGVQIKGERKLEELGETYNLNDFEEDDDYSNPGKSFMDTSSIYTFTNSTNMQPNDLTQVTPSYRSLQVSTRAPSQPPSALDSPQRDTHGTSTHSTTAGLAKLLSERGIHAIVPTAAHGREKVPSPTPTPAPSPEGSPPATPRSVSPVRFSRLFSSASIARGLFASSRRSRSVEPKRKSERKAPARASSEASKTNGNIGLMDKLNEIGLEKIMPSRQPSPAVIGRATSPRVPPTPTKLLPTPNKGSLQSIPDYAPLAIPSCSSTAVPINRTNTSAVCSSRLNQTIMTTSVQPLMSVGKLAPSPTMNVRQGESQHSPAPITINTSSSLMHPWGYVPPPPPPQRAKPAGPPPLAGLTPSVVPPLAKMPSPMMQLTSIRALGLGRSSDVGTVGTLRTLRKGGYI